MWDILLVILGGLLTVTGLIGCILPVLPGPPLNWLGLLCMGWALDWEDPFTAKFLALWAGVAIFVTALDYIVPAWGAKKAGASGYGIWGSVIGMIAGIIWFPPFGIILGSLVGAIVGEMLGGRSGRESLKAGAGVFLGTMFGTVLKLIASGIMTWYFVANIIEHLL